MTSSETTFNDEELIARLRDFKKVTVWEVHDAADRIEALQKALKDQSSVSDRLAEQLATCEKYRDAYDEMGRIGTQAVRDLEDKLALMVFERDEVIKFERDEAWKRAAHLEKMWGEAEAKLAECEARLGKAVEALEECMEEIDAYIRQEYPHDHPVQERYRQRDYAANPARLALAEIKGESHE